MPSRRSSYSRKLVRVYLRSEDSVHNRRRHYLVSLQCDLWGQLLVVRQWGRIGAAGWQGRRSEVVREEAEGARILQETLKRRRQYGYEVAEEG